MEWPFTPFIFSAEIVSNLTSYFAHSMKFKHLTSLALRDVVQARIGKEHAEFVEQFDPERWDYYRIKI